MKKFGLYSPGGNRNAVIKKGLIIMKITLLLILVSTFNLLATDTYSQTARVSLKLNQTSLKQALKEIERSSEFYFLYNNELVDVERKVDINADNEQINTILDHLFANQDVKYAVYDRQIVISPANMPLPQEVQRKVSGKVTDSTGGALPGVTVVVKGTTAGVITDANGHYSLTNIPANATLQFSFVGMKTKEIAVAGKTLINVNMEEATIGLEEVVAIGYGTIKKSDLTGSVASVKLKDANNNANVSVLQALQGSVPGLNIGVATNAGADPSLLVRGYNSLSAGQTPLIVVDGVIFTGSISDLSSSDIERVDVLKDASSAAVYGSRSANGVIILTTKQGVSEKPVFNFNTYHGFQSMTHKIKMMDGDEYVQKILDYRSIMGLESDPAKIESYLQPLEVENYRNKTYTDWIDLLTQTAPISQYDLSVSGKTNKTKYYLSGSYTDQEGIVLGDNFTRSTLRANFSNDITNWLTIGMNTSFSHKDYSGNPVNFNIQAIQASPLATVYNKETGELNLLPHNDVSFVNPLSYLKVRDENIQDNLLTVLFADIKIPKVNGLKFHFDYSTNLQFAKHNQFWDNNTYEGLYTPNGFATKVNLEMRDWTVNNILSYSKKINKHAVDATVLYSREGSKGESSNFTAKDFSTLVLGWNAMEFGKVQVGNSDAWESSNEAFMARFSYIYDMKYLLTATFRRDGFSGFAKGNKYANFASASLGWVISEENFAKSFDWLSFLKLRLSYGINGNQALGSYGSLSQMGMLNYVYGDGGSTSVGIYPSTMANSDLTWEKTKSLNLGLDFGVLKNRISGEIDVYKGVTNDLLVKRSLPNLTGYTNVWSNLGEISNKGIEFTLNTVNVSTTDFRWETKFSFSQNRNKIVHLYGLDANKDGKEDDDIGNSWFIGNSISAIYDYSLDGIYQLSDNNIPAGWAPGNFRVKEVDGVEGITEKDRSIVGYAIPNYRVGMFNELKYKNISLSFMINSIQGGGKDNYYIILNNEGLSANYRADRANEPDLDYWTPTNPTNKIPSLAYYGGKYPIGLYDDRSFVRLQDVSLAYSFDKTFLNKFGINNLKVYLSGKNLYTWTHFMGWDPEAGSILGTYSNPTMGTAIDAYPVMRSIVAGLNINF